MPNCSESVAIAKAKLIPLVFFGVTALRPLRPLRLCVPLASRAHRLVASAPSLRLNTEKKENGDAESILGLLLIIANKYSLFSVKTTLRVSVLSESNECNDLNAPAVAFG